MGLLKNDPEVIMKRIVIAAAFALVLLTTLSASVFAAPKKLATKIVDPFEGTFSGVIYGDKGSQAPLTLKMVQDGDEVYGTLFLGSGLYINGGRCGGGYIPASNQYAAGKIDKSNAHALDAITSIRISGFKVNIELEGLLSKDGENLQAEATVNLPWLCGRDPVVNAFLIKEQ